MVQCARFVAKDDAWIKRIKPNAPHSIPKAIVGPIAAGPKVVASAKSSIYRFIRSNYNDAQAVEMEGLGFLSAADANQEVKALVIRGISDSIDDKEKADSEGSQVIASRHAAAFAFEVLAQLFFDKEPPKSPEIGKLPEPGDLPNGSRLPFYRNAVFTGHREYLLWLANALLCSNEGGVGITQSAAVATGYGGLGKTQLAIELCYRYGRFFEGVHWIHADQDISAEIAACGSAMNLLGWPEKLADQLSLTLKALQEGESHLVVLDNIENSSVLQDWMPKLPKCRLLLTSQQSEWPPDIGLRIRPLEVLPRPQSIELLRRLALRLISISDKELDGIAKRLGDLPLALDLAGRYLADRPGLSPEAYLAALEEAGNALEHTSLKNWVKHSPTKHATSLAATFSLSWNRLAEDETDQLSRRVFRACGYCAPNSSIPLDLLKKAMNSDELLDRAMNRLSSLGLTIPADNRPSLHLLLAEFARLQDVEREELIILAEALGYLAVQATITGLPEQMRPLREHLRTVAHFAEAAGLHKAALLWNELGCHLRADGEYKEAKKCSARALMIDKKISGSNHPTIAKRFNNLGIDLYYLGNPRSAKKMPSKSCEN
jgi:hypothetical protein